jgi:hypothetical protein
MAYVETLAATDMDFGKALWQALRGKRGTLAIPTRIRRVALLDCDSKGG